jgi:hypothetical protein
MGFSGSGLVEIYVDPDDGWSVGYPPTMAVNRSVRGGHSTSVTIASFEMNGDIPGPDTLSPSDRSGVFPRDGVAFGVFLPLGPPIAPSAALEEPESRFPVTLDSFAEADELPRGEPAPLVRWVTANGRHYRALAWIGPEASTALRSDLAAVIRSLAFPHPRTGAQIGFGFVALEHSERYEQGSMTPVVADEQPMILVRSPGGFYALAWHWSGPPLAYAANCDHVVDHERLEIYCRSCEARWDRIGRPITKPATAQTPEILHLSVAKLAWDGHVLVNPGTYQAGTAPHARRYWPEWADGAVDRQLSP